MPDVPAVPDYSKPTPARKQIAADLRGQIRAGRYAPGSRLPSNVELAKHYGVANETIRAALDELRGEGFTATQSTRGTFVVDRLPADTPDLSAVATRMADLEARVKELEGLRPKLNLIEAVVVNVCARLGIEYPRAGGVRDSTEKAPRRGRAG